jgi:hypothetical protein
MYDAVLNKIIIPSLNTKYKLAEVINAKVEYYHEQLVKKKWATSDILFKWNWLVGNYGI